MRPALGSIFSVGPEIDNRNPSDETPEGFASWLQLGPTPPFVETLMMDDPGAGPWVVSNRVNRVNSPIVTAPIGAPAAPLWKRYLVPGVLVLVVLVFLLRR